MSSEVSSAARAPARRALSALEIVFLALAVLASAPDAVAQVYDVYKNSTDGTPIPDVNKAGVPPGPAAPPATSRRRRRARRRPPRSSLQAGRHWVHHRPTPSSSGPGRCLSRGGNRGSNPCGVNARDGAARL